MKKRNVTGKSFKKRLWEIIFEAETPLGKWFDIVLICLILLSVLAVMLETIVSVEEEYGVWLNVAEWTFTIIFSIEYALRLWLSRKPLSYAFSFYGMVDLLSCIPTYLAIIFSHASGFAIIRVLRLLRMFRILKMVHHVRGAEVILKSLAGAKAKITVFFFAVFLLSVLAGTLMYFVENDQPNTKFTSIPTSIYYAIVSITTVGYGDITATTSMGRILTTLMILSGYAIIAVPTGIMSSEMLKAEREKDLTSDACPGCGIHGHLQDAVFCRKCGVQIEDEES